MMKLYVRMQNLLNGEEGQGMVEYAMIIGLVAVGVLALLALLGTQVSHVFSSITGALSSFTN
jgi:pilus assembly protein Flp/PilA